MEREAHQNIFNRSILPAFEIKHDFQDANFFFWELTIASETKLLFIISWIIGQPRYLLIPLERGMLRASPNLFFVAP